jgi:hypothetical protein
LVLGLSLKKRNIYRAERQREEKIG